MLNERQHAESVAFYSSAFVQMGWYRHSDKSFLPLASTVSRDHGYEAVYVMRLVPNPLLNDGREAL